MKLIMKKIFIILMIICILFPMLFANISKAKDDSILLTTERAGNYVATFAINFFQNWSSISYEKTTTSGTTSTNNGTCRVPLDEGSFYYNRGIRLDENHYGQDYSTWTETPLIYSICAGTVEDTGYDDSRGNYAIITDQNGFKMTYMHMFEPPYVKKGETVEAGTNIGKVGNTGRSTGNHLHLEISTTDSSYYEKLGDKTIPYQDNDGVSQQPIVVYRENRNVYYICPRYYIENNGNILQGSSNTSSKKTSTTVIERGEIKTVYDDTADEKVNPVQPGDEQYVFSNRSWIDFVFKNALALDTVLGEDDDYTKYYPSSDYTSNTYYKKIGEDNITEDGILDITELVNSGKVLPGDILYSTQGEYLLYVGGTKVIYAQEPYDAEGALKYEYLQDYFIKVKNKITNKILQQIPESQREDAKIELPVYGIQSIYRIKEELIKVREIKENTENLFWNNKGYYDPNTEYSGVPIHGSYDGSTHTSLFGLIISAIEDIFWFLINLIFYIIRMVFVGWVSIVENIIQWAMVKLSGNTAQLPFVDKFTGLSATSYSSDKVTVESIFFNQLPITDANFFNFYSAGGHLLVDENGNETMLYILRQNLATWYTIIRNISIAIMLFILIYIGIRMALTTIAEKKADYKKMLTNWVQGLLIVLFIHFFMYGVFYLNDNLVELLFKLNQTIASSILGGGVTEVSLYEAIRTKAYAFDFLEGTTGLVFYIIIIYLLLRFLLIYLKRAISIYVLGMFGSFMGVKYALDKANGKKTSSLGNWMKDFAFNVLLQSIHCLIYTIFMSVALSTALTSVSGLVVSIVILQFMIQSDKIFMKIFGINAKGGLLEGVDKPESYFTLLTKAKIITGGAGKVFGFTKGIITGESETGKWIKMAKYADEDDDIKTAQKKVDMAKYQRKGDNAVRLNKIARKLPIGLLYKFTNTERQKMYRKLAENSSYEAKTQIYGNIQKQKNLKKQHYTRNLKTAKNLATGAFKTVAGVGLLVEGVAPAIHSTATGVSTINKELDRKTAKMYKRTSSDKNDLPGSMGALQIKDELAKEKYEKDMKKLEGKQVALGLITDYEAEINNTIKQLKEENTEKEEMEKVLGYVKHTVKATKYTNISASKIKRVVDRYMYKNNKTVLEESDLNNLMKELQKVLDKNEDNKIQIDQDTIRELVRNFNGESIDGLDNKKAAMLITEYINKPEVINIPELNDAINEVTDTDMKNKLKTISDNLKHIYGINQKSVIENKGTADDYNKVIKEFIKELEKAVK